RNCNRAQYGDDSLGNRQVCVYLFLQNTLVGLAHPDDAFNDSHFLLLDKAIQDFVFSGYPREISMHVGGTRHSQKVLLSLGDGVCNAAPVPDGTGLQDVERRFFQCRKGLFTDFVPEGTELLQTEPADDQDRYCGNRYTYKHQLDFKRNTEFHEILPPNMMELSEFRTSYKLHSNRIIRTL